VLATCGLQLNVRIATNGQEAIRYLRDAANLPRAGCPALVLLDLNLPRMSGLEVLRELRASRCKHTPVVIITSSVAASDRVAAERFGVEGYFHKPADLAAYHELAGIVKGVLRTNR
jgi:chemotaxis family two-component system response regulator Rcp1